MDGEVQKRKIGRPVAFESFGIPIYLIGTAM